MHALSRFVGTVVAFMLLGTVAGAAVGWLTAPVAPTLSEGAWRMASDRAAQRVVSRHMSIIWQYVDFGMSTGLGLGGAAGAAYALLRVPGVRDEPAPGTSAR